MKLREKLWDLRKENGISQLEVAEKLEVSRQTVSRWETGTSVPTTENLIRLSKLYNVPLSVWTDDAWTPDALREPTEPEAELDIPEPPAPVQAGPGRKRPSWRPAWKAVVLAVALAAGIAIGMWFSHWGEPEVVLQSDMNCEVIDLTTMGEPIISLPPKD